MIITTTLLKEQLQACTFVSNEVLRSNPEKMYRLSNLQRAERLGRISYSKVRITFQTMANENRMITSIVCSVYEGRVILQGGYSIPVFAILSVEF